jgi:uncharacterized NAD(P)/FAD-binding protein YdhS
MSIEAPIRLRAQARPRRSSEQAPRGSVVVVGGGAAGVLTAVGLSGAGLRPIVVADGPAPGRGVAYSTGDPLHRLNVPAGRMSVSAQEPDSFVQWLRAHRDPRVGAGDFVPRAWYGDYLTSVLEELVAAGRADLQRGRVSAITAQAGSGWAQGDVVVTLADGRRLRSSAVVLATGCPPPAADWAPAGLASDARLVLDPWSPGRLDAIAGAPTQPRRVLLVGAGLTMVDVALSVAARNPLAQITAVSRSGLLPTAHLPMPSPAIATPAAPTARMELEAVRELVAESITTALRETGDWRPGIDALRPITSALWAALSLPDRRRFLHEDRRRWDVRRHRMAPQVADAIAGLQRSGRLRVEALGRCDIAGYPSLGFDSIVSCTGQSGPLASDPLLAAMLADGSVQPDPLDLGLDCDAHGRLISRSGRAWQEVTVIGALRRGQLWESTAIPELRAQANEVAVRLAAQSTARLIPRLVAS